ncbi:hypothetical protein C7S16_6912 [Burkholderia thailandensis]|uniref:Uncharacterized protein n=1 Tax=Burkholderia thailandensis TaxID=57975 RepID=A0AAW9CXY4_BURTH|nr:hypothetical protein [Burkholderia thailandensis]MDW9252624.1 hypothetical protein [Burkholderia thailandensis]
MRGRSGDPAGAHADAPARRHGLAAWRARPAGATDPDDPDIFSRRGMAAHRERTLARAETNLHTNPVDAARPAMRRSVAR